MRGAFSSKRNFLFDLDGTLVDSVAVHARAYVETLSPRYPERARGFEYAPVAGRPTHEVFKALGMKKPELDEMTQQKQRLYRESIEAGRVKLFPGAAELLRSLQEAGRGLFLVTGASRISAERVLELTGIRTFFAGLITADEVEWGKPSPQPYLRALQNHALEPAECLAVEDGESGVQSAFAAGLDVVLVHAKTRMPGVVLAGDLMELSSLILGC